MQLLWLRVTLRVLGLVMLALAAFAAFNGGFEFHMEETPPNQIDSMIFLSLKVILPAVFGAISLGWSFLVPRNS
jgi:hypothetical protein